MCYYAKDTQLVGHLLLLYIPPLPPVSPSPPPPLPPFPLSQCWSDVEDLRREVAILELLRGHDHIVSISDAFEDEGVSERIAWMGVRVDCTRVTANSCIRSSSREQ